MENDTRTIHITLAGVPLSLTIIASQEEIIRKAAKMLNERVLKESAKHKGVEPEPGFFLAYVALLNTIKMLQQDQGYEDILEICSEIEKVIS